MPDVKEAPRFVQYEARRCPSCKSTDIRATWHKGPQRAYRCKACLWSFKARIV